MATPTEALQLIAKYKYLEAEFYRRALVTFASGAQAFTPGQTAVVSQISKHEQAHASALQTLLGGSAPARPAPNTVYDMSAGSTATPGTGPFFAFNPSPVPANNPAKVEFFKLAQLLEDFGVRVIKGQLPTLIPDHNAFALVSGMHSVEGRHAAEVRIMRSTATRVPVNASTTAYTTLIFPWILTSAGAIFDTTLTGGVAYGYSGTATDAASQAYVATLAYGVAPTGAAASSTPSTSEANQVQFGYSPTNAAAFDEPVDAAAAAAFLARFGVAA